MAGNEERVSGRNDAPQGAAIVTAVEAQGDIESLIERVNIDHCEVEIVSDRGSAVLMSKKKYDALVETGYLLSSPANAQRLLSSLQSVLRGTGASPQETRLSRSTTWSG